MHQTQQKQKTQNDSTKKDRKQSTLNPQLKGLANQSILSTDIPPQQIILTGNVSVVCRFRPLNQKEILESGDENICVKFLDTKTCTVNHTDPETGKLGAVKYNFDRIYTPESSQKAVYEESILNIMEAVLEGINGTVLAYGQTSSGKTHTMVGPDIEDEENRGIIPRMVKTLFEQIENSPEEIEFTVKVSMIEIYMEKIKDLLDPKKTNLKIHEDKVKGLYIDDITETYVGEEQEVYEIMRVGNDNRAIGVTNMNSKSSRSHSCFIMTIQQNNTIDFSSKTGKLYLVDLAGSEKVAKTGATGITLDEAKTINKSLTTLGIVITALTDGKSTHVPYRDSKLTRMLSESLGGNSKTCLIVTCSPSTYNEQETISTLKFGRRAKQIKNKPKINKDISLQELKFLLDQAEKTLEDKDIKIRILINIVRLLGEEVGNSENELRELEQKLMNLKNTKVDQDSTDNFLIKESKYNNYEMEQLKKQLPRELQKEEDLSDLKYDSNGDLLIFKELDLNNLDNFEVEEYIYNKSKQTQVNVILQQLRREIYKQNESNIKMKVIKKEFQNKLEINQDTQEQLNMSNSKIEKLESYINEQKIQIDQYQNEIEMFKVEFQKFSAQQMSQQMELQNSLNTQKELEVQKTVKDLLEKEKKLFEQEKNIIINSKKNMQIRIDELEKQLKKSEEKRLRMEQEMNMDEKLMKQKFLNFEKNLEQLTLMYQQLASQKQVMSNDIKILERKLKRKNDKIEEYEEEIKVTRQQVSQMQQVARELKLQINQQTLSNYKPNEDNSMYSIQTKLKNQRSNTLSFNVMSAIPNLNLGFQQHRYQQKVYKSIRGGGAKKAMLSNKASDKPTLNYASNDVKQSFQGFNYVTNLLEQEELQQEQE